MWQLATCHWYTFSQNSWSRLVLLELHKLLLHGIEHFKSHMLQQGIRLLRHTLPALHPQTYRLSPVCAFSAEAAQAVNHYEVLGVARTATAADIKSAFRKRAKALHPDLHSHLGRSDAAAFLALVSAYEVLSDAEQRRLYDAATDTQLPRVLRRAAHAAQHDMASTAGTPGTTPEQDADSSLNWRWGLAEWARHGPAASDPLVTADAAAAGSSGSLRVSVLGALQRHQRDLEVELHAALMTAFLGPRLELPAGELPSSFELDERSDPTLTDDLLHLVHGRTLLGVVALPTTLRLEGGADTPHLLTPEGGGSEQVGSPLLLPAHDDSSTSSTHRLPGSTSCLNQPQQQQQQQQQIQQPGASILQGHEHVQGSSARNQHPATEQQWTGANQQTAGAAEAARGEAAADAAAGAADPEAEIADADWRQLLQKQHPLYGAYDWVPATPSSSPQGNGAAGHDCSTGAGHTAETAGAAGPSVVINDHHRPEDLLHVDTMGSCNGLGSQPESPQQQQQQQCGQAVAHAAVDSCALGGRAAREAWEQHNQQLLDAADMGTADPAASEAGVRRHAHFPAHPACPGDDSCASMSTAWDQEQQQEGGAQPVKPCGQQQQQEQQQQSWQQQWHQLNIHEQLDMQRLWQQQWQEQRRHQDKQRDDHRTAPRSGHKRLWRWLRSPTADWLAADWSFTDECEGVLVLRLLQEGAVAAVAVRDEQQDNKPIKVYLDGVFYAAVLDDVVMQPLTGKLMGVLYRYYTPGVHHVYFYLPNKPGNSRVMARLQRRWMPPSSTWLFPPRAASHDRCSWVLEWEGFDAQHRPGWLHPAVYLLTAAYYSYDMECRRLKRKSDARQHLQEWVISLTGQAAWALDMTWSTCKSFAQKLQAVWAASSK